MSTGILSLYHGETKVGEGRIKTQPGGYMIAGEGLAVGRDVGDAHPPSGPVTPVRFEGPGDLPGDAGTVAPRLGCQVREATYQHLRELDHAVDCDVLVCGDDKEARAQVITLVEAAGMRGFHAGSIANAAAAEALTSLLIFINKQYS